MAEGATTAETMALAVETATATVKPRAYQQEMLAESLLRNIIVAMDTGSGKTQIAILRIQEELDRCAPHKFAWFLAPTVALAEQQHSVISQQLPAFQSRFLSGNDNVDHWSSQKVWDAILFNIRNVVSTPQVLLDAMSRGFVKMSRIALLVFDEAHRCVGSDPTNMIMQMFYHEPRRYGNPVELPAILGLSASPFAKPNTAGVKEIEENLHAICRTPVTQYEELMQYTQRPEISTESYTKHSGEFSEVLKSLDYLLELTLADIENDPYVLSLKAKKSNEKSQEKLSKILVSGKTYCRKELKALNNRAREIHCELGPWAADVFINRCLERFVEQISAASENDMFVEWDMKEKLYLMKWFSLLPLSPATRRWGSQPDILSQKAQRLIEVLTNLYNPGFRVIIFAQQRSTVVMLAHLLSVHPLMEGIVTSHFLGSTSYNSRKSSMSEIFHPRDQKGTINDLRIGKKNILVATSVLEEGIDVSACNIVICFDPPKILRSLIQRRGRAREKESKFIVFLDESDKNNQSQWKVMEERMKEIYSDHGRLLNEIAAQEDVVEDSPEIFRIPATGATLYYNNARQYLDHFCATISCAYTENQPDFVINRNDTLDLFRAKVILPSFLIPSLREARSKSAWRTEKMAKKDAAYQAYLSLYRAGLVDNNLMPTHCQKYSEALESAEKQGKLVQVSECFNPWVEMANLRMSNTSLFKTKIEFLSNPLGLPDMFLWLPRRLPCDLTFDLFWNEETIITVCLRQGSDSLDFEAHFVVDFSYVLLSSIFRRRMSDDCKDLVALFWPDMKFPLNSLTNWLSSIYGAATADEMITSSQEGFQQLGVAHSIEGYDGPLFIIEEARYIPVIDDDMRAVDEDNSAAPEAREILHFEGHRIPKRTDFLHPVAGDRKTSLYHSAKECVVAHSCSIARLPAKYSKFALFVPSIIHKIETLFVAERLSTTILGSIEFKNLHLVVSALSASSARDATDYQRLEFLGDSILKFHTSVHLTAINPVWHEGLLSSTKDSIVSNGRLSKAALDLGLDQFIIVKAFTGLKWRPSYISDFCGQDTVPDRKRELSSKVLADVVEALIGAAYIDGGIEKSSRCLRAFLPDVQWAPLKHDIEQLYEGALPSKNAVGSSVLSQVEALLEYKFTQNVLLQEALTHPCCQDHSMSYQRLEFLGDAVLDHLVVQELFKSDLSHQDMHLMRTTLVNADFLAFLCMDFYLEEDRQDPVSPGQAHLGTIHTTRRVYLWHFMRHSASWEITTAQQNAFQIYEESRDEIRTALATSAEYPWALLFRLEAGKFFSDLIESILGAIFVDSHGCLEQCRQFLDHLGLMSYLQRIVSGEIELLHPRNRLGHAARSETVSLQTKAEKVQSAEGSKIQWTCNVQVGDVDIIEISDGVNKTEVEARAFALAAAILEARNMDGIANGELSLDELIDHSPSCNGPD